MVKFYITMNKHDCCFFGQKKCERYNVDCGYQDVKTKDYQFRIQRGRRVTTVSKKWAFLQKLIPNYRERMQINSHTLRSRNNSSSKFCILPSACTVQKIIRDGKTTIGSIRAINIDNGTVIQLQLKKTKNGFDWIISYTGFHQKQLSVLSPIPRML